MYISYHFKMLFCNQHEQFKLMTYSKLAFGTPDVSLLTTALARPDEAWTLDLVGLFKETTERPKNDDLIYNYIYMYVSDIL